MNIKTNQEFQDEIANNIFPNGIYAGVSNQDYHSSPGISKSGLDLINKSPAHYQFATPRKPSAAMHIGTAVHTAILEPELFKRDYMLLENIDDKRKSEYKEAVKQFGKENVLIKQEASMIKGIQESINANPAASNLLNQEGYAELSFFATDENGILLKCRFDFLTESGLAIDLKTTQDASPYGFSKSTNEYRYHVQHAFYNHVYMLVTGNPLLSFVFLATEKESPFFNKPYTLTRESLEIGNYYMRKNLSAYTESAKTGHWPMPDNNLEELDLPSWAINQYEEEIEGEIK